MLFDSHSDLGAYFINRQALYKDDVVKDLIAEYQRNHVKAVIAAIFLENNEVAIAKEQAFEQIATLRAIIKKHPELHLALHAKDLEEAKENNQTAIMISLEGAEPISSPIQVALFKDLGVRFVGLTWIRRNRFADGAEAKTFMPKGGLSQEGVELVKAMEEENMVIDLSHLSDEGIHDVFEHFSGPLFSSHTNARAINNIPRNHPDEILKEISNRGGVVGLNIASFIVNNEKTPTLEDLSHHLLHMIKVCGEDQVVLGFDFCNKLFNNPYIKEKATDVLVDYDDATEYLTSLQGTLSDDVIEKIAYHNMARFLKERL